jgi:hypothetical protein
VAVYKCVGEDNVGASVSWWRSKKVLAEPSFGKAETRSCEGGWCSGEREKGRSLLDWLVGAWMQGASKIEVNAVSHTLVQKTYVTALADSIQGLKKARMDRWRT